MASGVLTLAQAAPLVRLRAAAMQEAVPVGTGAMAAVLGLPADKVREVCAAVTAQRDAQPRLQFAYAKRFTQVVIGAGVKGGDFVMLFAARRQHDNRHLAPLANFTDKIITVPVRQAEIEDR